MASNDDRMTVDDGGKIPNSLNITQGPPMGARAVRRRFVTSVQNNTTYNPQDYASIYLDTSTPGAFIDHESVYLCFDFQVLNSNYCVDYTDFGVEGVGGAIINYLKWGSAGNTLEEITYYGIGATALTTLYGENMGECKQFFSAYLRGGHQNEFHRNFIKPPMIDSSKNIMFGPNPQGLGLATFNNNSVYAQVYDSANQIAASEFLQGGSISYYAQSTGNTQGNLTAGEMANLGAPGNTNTWNAGTQTASDGSGAVGTGIYPYNWTQPTNNTDGTYIASAGAEGLYYVPCWNNTMLNATQNSNPNVVLQYLNTITPMDFPNLFCPSMVEFKDKYTCEYGTINEIMVLTNLSNVKCYPIGCYSAYNAWNIDNGSLASQVYGPVLPTTYTALSNSTAPTASNPSYRITYRPYSGILGKMTTKMLVSFLVAPQSMFLQIQFAPAYIALNVSSDPCRRITGTIRDYIRNSGFRNNSTMSGNTNFTIQQQTGAVAGQSLYRNSDVAGSGLAPNYAPFNSIPPMFNTFSDTFYFTASPSTIFNSAAAKGQIFALGAWEQGAKSFSLNQTGQFVNPCGPRPQYALSVSPWNNKLQTTGQTTNTLIYAIDTQCFYGTYMDASVPQSARIFDLAYAGNTTQVIPGSGLNNASTSALSYAVTNLSLIGDQIIVADSVTARIITAATANKLVVPTRSIRTYQLVVPTSSTQSIVCPFNVTSAESVYFVFQNSQQYSGQSAYVYDSLTGFNPFALVSAGTNTIISKSGFSGANAASTLYGVGWTSPITVTNTSTAAGAFTAQMRIGNEYFPKQQITSVAELATELYKTLGEWGNPKYNAKLGARITTKGTTGTVGFSLTGTSFVYNCLAPSTYLTAFIPYNCLDDQTIIANPDMGPLYVPRVVADTAAGGIMNATALPTNSNINAANTSSATNPYNWLCPRGYCLDEVFKSPTSNFILGIKLDTFSKRDGVKGGLYLIGSNIVLDMTGAVGLSDSATSQIYRAIAIIPHQANMKYQPGGQLVWMY